MNEYGTYRMYQQLNRGLCIEKYLSPGEGGFQPNSFEDKII
jgi:hypothetical protein